MSGTELKENIIKSKIGVILRKEENINDISNLKFMGVEWDGCIFKNLWFVFSEDGKTCWIANATDSSINKITVIEATPDDWSCIGPNSCNGFMDYDFRGCDFQDFDISGTQFTRCIFDNDAFDYIITSHSDFIECLWGDDKSTKSPI